MGNQHSPGYPRPFLQTTVRVPLPPGNTHHPAPYISQESGSSHHQAPLYAPVRSRFHRTFLCHAGHPHLRLSCQKLHCQPLHTVSPVPQVMSDPVRQNDNLTILPHQSCPPGQVRNRIHQRLWKGSWGGSVLTQTKTALNLPVE